MRALAALLLLGTIAWAAAAQDPPPAGKDAGVSKSPAKVNHAIKEVAGTAEFLRNIPKKFGAIQEIDAAKGSVTLLLDGDKEPTTWPLTPDAELKVRGWWGRLEQFANGERVWA